MKRATSTPTMSPEAFTAALRELGWKQTEFARRTGMTQATVNAWANGRAPAPPWAAAYLEAMLDISALYRKYLAPQPAPGAAYDDLPGPTHAPARLTHVLPASPPPAAE